MKKILTVITVAFAITPAFANAAAVSANADASASVTANHPLLGNMRADMHASTTASSSMMGMKGMGEGRGDGKNASSTVRDAAIDKAVNTANNEVTMRIDVLNKLSDRIQGLKNVSVTQKASIAAEVQTQSTTLNALFAKIQAEASSTMTLGSTSPLRMDIKSIADAYRIYMLIIPQGSLLSAADRVNTIATSLTTIAAKLQVRITAAQSAGKDVTALNASLADLTAKVADAQVQATAATTAVSGLTPDNGNATIQASNTAALKTGRADIKTATADLQAADKDAKSIIKAIQGFHISTTASTTATASTSSQ